MTAALQAIVLGIIQGLTEFLPVSSSGHLVLVQRVFGWHFVPSLQLSFDVALHVGTLLALLIFFRKEWIELIKGFFTSLRVSPRDWSRDQKLAWMLVLGSIPAGVAGVLIGEDHLSKPAWVAIFLICGSLIMVAAELWGSRSRRFGDLRAWDAGTVGLAQAIALLPGISRSGITISTGMLDGLEREAAAHFAFLLSAPVIAGAGLWQGQKMIRQGVRRPRRRIRRRLHRRGGHRLLHHKVLSGFFTKAHALPVRGIQVGAGGAGPGHSRREVEGVRS